MAVVEDATAVGLAESAEVVAVQQWPDAGVAGKSQVRAGTGGLLEHRRLPSDLPAGGLEAEMVVVRAVEDTADLIVFVETVVQMYQAVSTSRLVLEFDSKAVLVHSMVGEQIPVLEYIETRMVDVQGDIVVGVVVVCCVASMVTEPGHIHHMLAVSVELRQCRSFPHLIRNMEVHRCRREDLDRDLM